MAANEEATQEVNIEQLIEFAAVAVAEMAKPQINSSDSPPEPIHLRKIHWKENFFAFMKVMLPKWKHSTIVRFMKVNNFTTVNPAGERVDCLAICARLTLSPEHFKYFLMCSNYGNKDGVPVKTITDLFDIPGVLGSCIEQSFYPGPPGGSDTNCYDRLQEYIRSIELQDGIHTGIMILKFNGNVMRHAVQLYIECKDENIVTAGLFDGQVLNNDGIRTVNQRIMYQCADYDEISRYLTRVIGASLIVFAGPLYTEPFDPHHDDHSFSTTENEYSHSAPETLPTQGPEEIIESAVNEQMSISQRFRKRRHSFSGGGLKTKKKKVNKKSKKIKNKKLSKRCTTRRA